MVKIISLIFVALEGFYNCADITRTASLIEQTPEILPALFILCLEILLHHLQEFHFRNLCIRGQAEDIHQLLGIEVVIRKIFSHHTQSI